MPALHRVPRRDAADARRPRPHRARVARPRSSRRARGPLPPLAGLSAAGRPSVTSRVSGGRYRWTVHEHRGVGFMTMTFDEAKLEELMGRMVGYMTGGAVCIGI